MSRANEVRFTLKVMINKQKNKVLFAEVDSHFADVLLSFLTLPLGTIIRVLKKHYGDDEPINIGSLTTLYDGLANLSHVNFGTEGCKKMLLDPRSSFEAECRKLKLDINDAKPAKYFNCYNLYKSCPYEQKYVSMYRDTVRCLCGKLMTAAVSIKEPQTQAADGVFVNDKVSFLISDDLQIVPNVAVPIVQTLRNFGITDTNGAEMMNVTFGYNEIMYLLKGSVIYQSPTLLTDIILKRRKMDSAIPTKSQQGIFFHQIKREASDSKKAILNVIVHKSTNKLLFAQADDDFIDFLCSLLTIPLGGVACLLDGKTCLKGIDNLYKSIKDLIDDKYLATPDIKNNLVQPKLTHAYMSKNQILPLSEQNVLQYQRGEWLHYNGGWATATKGQVNYVEGSKMYVVSDDLTVTSSCVTSSIFLLNEMKIPLYDVREVKVHVGLQEVM